MLPYKNLKNLKIPKNREVYFALGSIKPNKDKRMTENYIFSRNLLVSDIDMRDIPWNKLSKKEREDYITYLKNYILETLKDHNLEPHFVVFSGRGFHLYYRFQKMVLAKKDIKALLKDTQQVLYKKIKEVLGFLPDENGNFREVQID